MFIGERLKQLRKEKQLTQIELGEVLKVSDSTIENFETSLEQPDNAALVNMAKFFNVSVDYLLGLADIPKCPDKTGKEANEDSALLEFWSMLKKRPHLQLLFHQTQNLDDKTIQQIIRIIKAMDDDASTKLC